MVRMNSASAFQLLRACTRVYKRVTARLSRDSELPCLHASVHAKLLELGNTLHDNERWQTADVMEPKYAKNDYQYKVVPYVRYSG